MLLDKPKLAVTWKRGLDDLKSGRYAAASKAFKELDDEASQSKAKQQ